MNLSIMRTFALGILLTGILLPLAGFASGVVSTMDETNLRQALLGGGTVLFASDGVIPLSQTIHIANDTTIDAGGHNVALDGQNKTQIFYVQSNATLTIKGLTLRNGTVGVFYSTFSSSYYSDLNTNNLFASGGAVCSFGGMVAVGCRFESNSVTIESFSEYGFSAGLGLAKGGAISSQGVLLALTNCVFVGNSASGNDPAYGGAVSIEGGSAAFDDVRFISNSVGGLFGGAMYVSQSTVVANSADLERNTVSGYTTCGGGVYIDSGSVVFSNSFFGHNVAYGGGSDSLSGRGGNGSGGSIYNNGTLTLVNSTLSANQAIGGESGRSPGAGSGGGVYVAAGSAAIISSTLINNTAMAGASFFSSEYGISFGSGVNLFVTTNGSVSVTGTMIVAGTNLLTSIQSFRSSNCSGVVSDLGSNLQWPTNDCGATIPSVDPLLQLPADNGGFVKTAAILSNSAAVGANTSSCLAIDARGVARVSSGCDIGAFQTTGSDPQFVMEPVESTAGTGANIQLVSSAIGTGPLTYQWWFNGAAMEGQTNDTISLSSVDQTDVGTYSVVVSNAVGAITSSNAVLQVADIAPSIRYQPTAHVLTSTTNVSLFVVADGTPPLSYQWQCDGTNISGATDQSQSLTNFMVNVGDSFQVVVSNLTGDVTSANAIISGFEAPTFVVQPTDQNYTDILFDATFLAQCEGTQPLYYQWTRNGTNIVGATSNRLELTFTGTTAFQPLTGIYQLQVSNDYGVALSAPARLDGPPIGAYAVTITAGGTVPVGGQVTMRTSITSGSEPFSYQWSKDGGMIGDATNASLTLNNGSLADSGTYTVSISNPFGIWYEEGTLTVYHPATFLKSPQSVRANWGSKVAFSCKGGGTPPLHYEWYYQGAQMYYTNSTLTIPRSTSDNAGSYTVVVSNPYSAITSAPVTLSFIAATPHIIAPANNLRTTQDSVLLRGTCSTPDDGSTYIWCSDNNDGESPAQWSDGLRSWSMLMPLDPGTNVLQVWADNGWEQSAATSVALFCVRTTSVSVVVSPPNAGQVSPNLHGNVEFGRGYHLTATPAANYILSNWSGSVSATSRSVDVVMDWDTVIQANFVTNPFPAVAGNYEGLYFENDAVRRDSSGLLLASLDKSGGITVRAFNAGGIGFGSGEVEVGGHVHLPISRGGKSWLVMDGQLDFVTHQITGTLQGDVWTAGFDCEKALKPFGNTNEFSGRYTYAIGGGDDAETGPLGQSVGTASISGTGILNATTYFSDRGVASQSTAVTETGRWPFYAAPWNGRGEALGWVMVSAVDRSFSGNVTSIRLPIASALYPAGYTNTTWIAGGLYDAADKTVWPDVNSKTLVFTGGNLTNEFSVVGMNLGAASYRNPMNKLSMNFNSSTGVFSGSFVNPATAKVSTIQAVVLQGLTNVTGYFVGTNRSGLLECE